MTQRPRSNLGGASEDWRRFIESELDGIHTDIQSVLDELHRLGTSDGGQAALYAQLTTGPIQLLTDQLKSLYVATGNTYPPTAAAPPAPPVVPTYKTIETTAVWSRTWGSSTFYTGGGHYTDATMLYQGSNPEAKIGIWGISMGAAANKKITNMQVFLQNTEFSWASSGTAALGTHQYATAPSAKPNRSNGFDVAWSEGQGKFAGIPAILWPGFSNGTFKGLSVGGIGPNDANSAIFMGVGQSLPPRLRITYQV